ncbi:complement factor H-related protein 1-like [Poeciliopsis prolifica]|uniref:complement factor H-related protein 1-like n=1 Tax=Poeciliopsis prolifica TaxID=188132 RepID=UPI00241397AB|nr:complement factor H-related protein 1-like [Poeciliopsis prolifica]
MWLTGLRFALLLWVPAALAAASGRDLCGAPTLTHGYFLPVRESYPHDSQVTYSCDAGYKTTVEGWWATIVCQDGDWSDKPKCVVETACLPPVIPNGQLNPNPNGSLEVSCKAGYSLNGQENIMECLNGTWSAMPLCQKHRSACGQPPAVTNAVVTRTHQEMFDEFSTVEYQCRDGFLTEDSEFKTTANCEAGKWVRTPRCTRAAGPGSPDTQTTFVSIDNCGDIPHVQNGVVVEQTQQNLKYECQRFYKMVGLETVVCYRGGIWSKVPKCKENFCHLNTTEYPDLINTGDVFIMNGETVKSKCVDKWKTENHAVVRCIEGKLSVSRCCSWMQPLGC